MVFGLSEEWHFWAKKRVSPAGNSVLSKTLVLILKFETEWYYNPNVYGLVVLKTGCEF